MTAKEKDIMERKMDDAEPALKQTLDKQIKNYENMLAHIRSPQYHEVLQKLIGEMKKCREELDMTNNTNAPVSSSSNSVPNVEMVVQFDGGARGNPGVAGAGAIGFERKFEEENDMSDARNNAPWYVYGEESNFVGYHETNNVAEYYAYIHALERLVLGNLNIFDKEHPPRSVRIRIEGDSTLVLNQVQGKWKVQNEKLKPLKQKATELLERIRAWPYSQVTVEHKHISRSQNYDADDLANMAMDKASRSSDTIHDRLRMKRKHSQASTSTTAVFHDTKHSKTQQ
jgi:ribonuclease HI